ncbi:hypothetical protein H4R19_000462 [Coemansia spiralis]|nr:hypothetical protein H4R19_000462 [Coemansia spiralis]
MLAISAVRQRLCAATRALAWVAPGGGAQYYHSHRGRTAEGKKRLKERRNNDEGRAGGSYKEDRACDSYKEDLAGDSYKDLAGDSYKGPAAAGVRASPESWPRINLTKPAKPVRPLQFDLANREELVVGEVRDLLQRNEPIPWYDLTTRYKLTHDSLLQILSQHDVGSVEWVKQSAKVTLLADRNQNAALGRSDWEAVANELGIPVVDALCLFDVEASQVPVRQMPSFADWSPADTQALRQFIASTFLECGRNEWQLAGIYMNVRPADCRYVVITLETNTMTFDLLRLLTKRLEKGDTWDALYKDYPVADSERGLQRLYYSILHTPSLLRERRDRHKWSFMENSIFARYFEQHLALSGEAALTAILVRELPGKSLMEIEDKMEFKMRRVKHRPVANWRKTRVTYCHSEEQEIVERDPEELEGMDLDAPRTLYSASKRPAAARSSMGMARRGQVRSLSTSRVVAGKKAKGPISVPRGVADTIVELRKQKLEYDEIAARLPVELSAKNTKAVYLQKTAKPAPRPITPAEYDEIKSLIDNNAETMAFEDLCRLIKKGVGKDNWCNVLNFIDEHVATHPVYKARLDSADTPGMIAEVLRGKPIAALARKLNVSPVMLNVHIRTHQYKAYPKLWTQDETDVLVAYIDEHGSPSHDSLSHWQRVADVVKTKNARQCLVKYRDLKKLNLL